VADVESGEGFFVGKLHCGEFSLQLKFARFHITSRIGYCDLKELVSVERGPRRALNQFNCAEAN